MTKTRPFLSTCYGYPSTTEVPPCCQAATKKLTFSTTSVLLLLNVPLSLSRGTVFRRPKNPRRGSRPKIAGILFVCNEPEGKYYTVPLYPSLFTINKPLHKMAEDPECTTREMCAVSVCARYRYLLISIKRALPVFIDINKEGATGISIY